MIENSADTAQGNFAGKNSARAVLYASLGPELIQYDLDVDSATLVKRGSVLLPAGVSYAWPHASKRYLYVTSSDWHPLGPAGKTHHIAAFRIDPESGALQPHGEPVALRHSQNHISTDLPSQHALISHPYPSNDSCGISVHQINQDGSIGGEVKQRSPLDTGFHAHQIRVTPSNRSAILVTLGNDAVGGKAEDPGALKIFNYSDGLLTNRSSIAPDGGHGFGPRHLDFHPVQPWIYVSLERQNKLYVHKLEEGGVSAEPLYRKETLANPSDVRPEQKQIAGAIHVHPDGRFVYVANRAYQTMNFEGKRIFRGGKNDIAVYAINEGTGEPTLIQNIDTRGIYARTFSIDPSGRILIAANMTRLSVKDGDTFSTVSSSLSIFRIGGDGKLNYVRKYDVDVDSDAMRWMGFV